MNKITKSIDTVRERELYFKENVGENAYIYLQKHINKLMSNEMSKYYSTFFKIEKDNKAGRPKDAAHIQEPKSNLAITLIALIITIIVLLILAGVTLNMVIGKNGIFGKASNAKSKTEIAQYEEELQLCILEIQADKTSKNEKFNMDTIKNNLEEYVLKLQNEKLEWTDKDIDEPRGIYKTNNFYIDKYYKVHIEEKGSKTTIELTVKSNLPESGYTNQPEDISITIKNENGLKKITKEDGSEIKLENKPKSWSIEYPGVDTNRSYTYVVEDINGNVERKKINVENIDRLPPQRFNITTEIKNGGLQINAHTEDEKETETDACSGIDRYEYYVKTNSSEEYRKYTDPFIPDFNAEDYLIYVIAYDKAGNKRKSLNPRLKLNLGENNSLLKTYKGTPQYMGKENGVYMNNAILTTKCMLNSTYTILIETKDIELNSGSNHFGMIIGYGVGDSGVGGYALGICEWYNSYIGALSGAGDSYSRSILSSMYPANRWNTLAIKYDGKEFAFYLNGAKKGSSNASANKGSNLYIGGFSNAGTNSAGVNWGYSNGYYRNVAIYDQALDDDEIANYEF